MTVNIVGKDQTVVKRVTCRNCASLLEYTQSDTRKIKHSCDYLGDCEIDDGITCPNCGKDVIL